MAPSPRAGTNYGLARLVPAAIAAAIFAIAGYWYLTSVRHVEDGVSQLSEDRAIERVVENGGRFETKSRDFDRSRSDIAEIRGTVHRLETSEATRTTLQSNIDHIEEALKTNRSRLARNEAVKLAQRILYRTNLDPDSPDELVREEADQLFAMVTGILVSIPVEGLEQRSTTCAPGPLSLEDLSTRVDSLSLEPQRKAALRKILAGMASALEEDPPRYQTVRQQLARLMGLWVHRSDFGRLPPDDATALICGAMAVLRTLPSQ